MPSVNVTVGKRPTITEPRKAWCPRLSPKQLQVLNSNYRHILLNGPRYCGKTIASMHKLLRHAWETPNGRVGMFAKNIKNAKNGVWDDITKPIMSEWLKAGLKGPNGTFAYTKTPGITGDSRMSYFRIRNYHGNESEIQLHSLDYDGDIAEKIMGTRFSCIYFSELQHFHDASVFDLTKHQLKMAGLPFDAHLWLADTNPADEGEKHFAYKKWYVERISPEIPKSCVTEEDIASYRASQNELGLFEFTVDDNIYGDKREIEELKNTYRNDPEGWARYIEGKWTKGKTSKGKIFWGFWKPDVHIAGNCSHPNKANWEYLNPSESCSEIVLGWDIGSTRNHAVTFLEPFVTEQDKIGFRQLDEVVWTDVEEPLGLLVEQVLERMDILEQLSGRKIRFRHWSDHSAFQYRASGAAEYEATHVYRVSDGRIRLMSALGAKSSGSVNRRIQMVKELLADGRYSVSAHCVNTIEMFSEIRHGEVPEKEPISKMDTRLKHPWDGLSYAIFCELFQEARTGPTRADTGSRLVSLAY